MEPHDAGGWGLGEDVRRREEGLGKDLAGVALGGIGSVGAWGVGGGGWGGHEGPPGTSPSCGPPRTACPHGRSVCCPQC